MFQMLLGNVLQIRVTLNDLGIAGIVLNQSQRIGGIDGAALGAFLLGDHHLNILLQQYIAAVRANFGHGIGVILQTLNQDSALGIAGFHRDKVRGIFLVGSVAGHIVHAFVLIKIRLYKVIIGFVLYQEFHLGEIALAVRKQLGKVNAVGINMGIVHQGIVESLAGTLPGQHHLVVVALVAHHQGIIAIYFGSVGQAHSAVGEAGIDHTCIGIDSLGIIDFCQALGSHFHRHSGFAILGIVIGNGEIAVCFLPGSHRILAGGIGEDF